MQVNQWAKCYESGWKDIIVPEAFSHPAKMAYGLLKRIFAHAKIQGWLKEGDVIVDPFGGIGSTGILGAYEGYQCVCCELEEKFYRMANSYECPGITKIGWLRWYNRFGRNKELCPKCLTDVQQWYEKHSGIIPSKEPHHFVGNFELHKDAWVEFGHPFPVILQGDSRQLCQIVEKADCIVSSPPFVDQQVLGGSQANGIRGPKPGKYSKQNGRYSQTPGQLGSMKPGKVDAIISSPPYAGALGNRKHEGDQQKYYDRQKKYNEAHPEHKRPSAESMCYPCSDGNLAGLKPGKVDMVVSSPPYAEAIAKRKGPSGLMGGTFRLGKSDMQANKEGYSQNPKNLGNLKSGDVDAIISSPPYEGSIQTDGDGIDWSKIKEGGTNKTLARAAVGTGYGKTNGQLAEDKGDTFWSAAKLIIEECFKILKPGGHAIWVVKSFVRNKKIVDFPGDWQRLCESVGFKTVCVHHAMLVKETKHQTLFGDTEVKRKERKSFFRRLAEFKGSPPIDFEIVLCMRKECENG